MNESMYPLFKMLIFQLVMLVILLGEKKGNESSQPSIFSCDLLVSGKATITPLPEN